MDRREKIAAACRLRAQGKVLKDIAEAIGVSVATASVYCRGILPFGTSAPDPRKEEGLRLLREFYTAGVPISELAKRSGVPATTLYDWRREAGITRNRRSVYVTDELRDRIRRKLTVDPSGALRKQVVTLYTRHELTTTDIARRLGVSSVTVGQWLKQAGVARRRRPTRRTREKLRQANLGDKRYNWKGGITPRQVRIRNSLEMRLAREACFERDNYTCQSCGKHGGKLNAHHIWPFHRFPDRKFDVHNLVTLCRECHNEFHKRTGGHVKMAIGPFFDLVKEMAARYGAKLSA